MMRFGKKILKTLSAERALTQIRIKTTFFPLLKMLEQTGNC